jgi:DNA ligase-1
MPKSIKSAPPQQSSLKEMWGGNRKHTGAAGQPSALSSKEGEQIGVDDIKTEIGESDERLRQTNAKY